MNGIKPKGTDDLLSYCREEIDFVTIPSISLVPDNGWMALTGQPAASCLCSLNHGYFLLK